MVLPPSILKNTAMSGSTAIASLQPTSKSIATSTLTSATVVPKVPNTTTTAHLLAMSPSTTNAVVTPVTRPSTTSASSSKTSTARSTRWRHTPRAVPSLSP
jgi:hypothetical protein